MAKFVQLTAEAGGLTQSTALGDITQIVNHLRAVREGLSLSVPAFVSELHAAMEESGKEELHPQDWAAFEKALTEALSGASELNEWYSLDDELAALAEEWKTTRPMTNGSVLKSVLHPAYQRIIGKGRSAVPFLLRELQREPDHWFWALTAITGEDPVSPEVRGNLREMAAAWVAWGKVKGYL